MKKLFKNRKFLVGIIVVVLLAIPIGVYAQINNHQASPSQDTNKGTIIRPETLPSLEEAQQRVDFPIMVPSYLPEGMKLAKRGIAYSPYGLNLMYEDLSESIPGDIESVKSISLHQKSTSGRVVDIEYIRKECENYYVDGKKYYAEIKIQGVTAFWTPYGMGVCEKAGDELTCHLNSRYIRVNWWANGVSYVIIAHNVPPEEVLAFAKSLTYFK